MFKKIFKFIIYNLKVYKFVELVRSIVKGKYFTVITYHSFTDNPHNENDFRMHADIFENQIKFLKKNYNIESLGNIIKLIKNGEKLKKNYVCITIDDGFLDNYEVAYPILKKYMVPATIFVTSRLIRGTNEILNKSDAPACSKLNDSSVYRLPEMPMMSWDNIKEMSNGIIEIGSHTLNHPIVTKVTFEVAKEEIKLSKKEIEENINKQVTLFAFPNGQRGDYNDTCCDLVKDAGYDCACIIEFGTNYDDVDLYRLKRITVSNMSIPQFALKVSLILSAPKMVV